MYDWHCGTQAHCRDLKIIIGSQHVRWKTYFSWCNVNHYCTTSLNRVCSEVHDYWFGGLWWRDPPTMVPARKAQRLLLIHCSTKTIHRHYNHHHYNHWDLWKAEKLKINFSNSKLPKHISKSWLATFSFSDYLTETWLQILSANYSWRRKV